MKRVLFVCVHNAGRSQMAEAFARLHGGDMVIAESAGTMPAQRVHPVVVEAMRERGIDLSSNQPKLLTDEMVRRANRVVTMGCGVEEACPAVYVAAEDWGIDDPANQSIERVRRIRDDIEARVRRLLAEMAEVPSKPGRGALSSQEG